MRQLLGAALLIPAAIGVAIGTLWAVAKAMGGEVDICTGAPPCTSAWYYAGPIIAISLLVAGIGVAVLRGGKQPSPPA
jgi:hypothetical protein